MILITDPRCLDYATPGHPERPERISTTCTHIRKQSALKLEWMEPLPVSDEILLRAHTQKHLERLSLPEDFDGDTAFFKGIGDHARRSVGAALQSLAQLRAGKSSFSLMRPPGHHACREQAMGFCYLNQAAILAFEAQKQGYPKVAVFDFDVHHGNGTEDILKKRKDTAYFSVHLYPFYPGTGRDSFDNIHNYPVAPGAARDLYRETLVRSLDDLKQWKPDLIVVSAGFDAYEKDPLGEAPLLEKDFEWLGRHIQSLDIPFLSILEGGYSPDLPALILSYLKGSSKVS